jgi:oxygen-independent coproporphyrinogen-3 oxidase
LRRNVIQALACDFRAEVDRSYFAAEWKDLEALEDDGLVSLCESKVTVTPAGRLLVRRVCMVFDRYLRERRERATYSKVV